MDSINSALWRKSSYSANNGTNCVEVAPWRKSSYSGNNGGDCVEVAPGRKASNSANSGTNCLKAGDAARGRVLVRDTTNRDGTVLDIPAAAWDHFTATLR